MHTKCTHPYNWKQNEKEEKNSNNSLHQRVINEKINKEICSANFAEHHPIHTVPSSQCCSFSVDFFFSFSRHCFCKLWVVLQNNVVMLIVCFGLNLICLVAIPNNDFIHQEMNGKAKKKKFIGSHGSHSLCVQFFLSFVLYLMVRI